MIAAEYITMKNTAALNSRLLRYATIMTKQCHPLEETMT